MPKERIDENLNNAERYFEMTKDYDGVIETKLYEYCPDKERKVLRNTTLKSRGFNGRRTEHQIGRGASLAIPRPDGRRHLKPKHPRKAQQGSAPKSTATQRKTLTCIFNHLYNFP